MFRLLFLFIILGLVLLWINISKRSEKKLRLEQLKDDPEEFKFIDVSIYKIPTKNPVTGKMETATEIINHWIEMVKNGKSTTIIFENYMWFNKKKKYNVIDMLELLLDNQHSIVFQKYLAYRSSFKIEIK